MNNTISLVSGFKGRDIQTKGNSNYSKNNNQDFNKVLSSVSLKNSKKNLNEKRDISEERKTNDDYSQRKTNEEEINSKNCSGIKENNEINENSQIKDQSEMKKSSKTEVSDDLKDASGDSATSEKKITGQYIDMILALLSGNKNLQSEIDVNQLKNTNAENLKNIIIDVLKGLNIEENNSSDTISGMLKDMLSMIKDADNENSSLDINKILNKYLASNNTGTDKDISELKNTIIEEINKKLKNNNLELKNDNLQSKISSSLDENTKQVIGAKNSNESSNNSLMHKKDEKVLEGLLNSKDKLDSQFDKVSNFMNQFSTVSNAQTTAKSDQLVISRDNFAMDMVKAVKFMDTNDAKELAVKIMPRELGEVVIKLTMESGIMKAQISAANKETAGLLNANLQDITDKLNNSNIKIQNVTIDIYNDDTTFFSEQFNRNNGNQQGSKKSKNLNGSISEVSSENENSNNVINDLYGENRKLNSLV